MGRLGPVGFNLVKLCIHGSHRSPPPTHAHTPKDVAVREAEAVELQGDRVDDADTGSGSGGGLNPRQAGMLRWAADTYMQVGRVERIGRSVGRFVLNDD